MAKKATRATVSDTLEDFEEGLVDADTLDQMPSQAEIESQPASAYEPPQAFRYSDLERLVQEHAKAKGVSVASIDRCRFIREEGLPVPTRRYKVIGSRSSGQKPIPGPKSLAFETEAVDESDAIRLALDAHDVRPIHRHRWRCQVAVLAQ